MLAIKQNNFESFYKEKKKKTDFFLLVCKYLLEKHYRININLITLQGTALHIAYKIDNRNIIDLLMCYKPNLKYISS